MKLFLISQDRITGWDTYDSAVVAAPNEIVAKNMHPDGGANDGIHYGWCAPEYVTVKYLGSAGKGIEQGVLCASFNAGGM